MLNWSVTHLELFVTQQRGDELSDLFLDVVCLHEEQVTEHHHLRVAQDGRARVPRRQQRHLQSWGQVLSEASTHRI